MLSPVVGLADYPLRPGAGPCAITHNKVETGLMVGEKTARVMLVNISLYVL